LVVELDDEPWPELHMKLALASVVFG